MNNKSITDFIKPTIITAQQYGTKVSVEIDHSDTDIDELFDAFQTLVIGLGYHQSAWKSWIIDRADEYRENDAEDLKEKLEAWKFEDDDNELKHRYTFEGKGYESLNELENDFFGPREEINIDAVEEMRKYAEEEMAKEAERRMDIIGQNGNEGLHYDSDGGFGGKPNKALKLAAKEYKKVIKKTKKK
jgi:hypothetical protein